jgi:hypothetical protein
MVSHKLRSPQKIYTTDVERIDTSDSQLLIADFSNIYVVKVASDRKIKIKKNYIPVSGEHTDL